MYPQTTTPTLNNFRDRDGRGGCPSAIILTALGLEAKAVRAHLSDITEIVGEKGVIYECGYFSGGADRWFIAVAETGAGNQGAGSFVHSALRDFKQIDLVFFVGVAGGIKKDVKIGHVVASTKIYCYHAGKSADEFEIRPQLQMADLSLEQAARLIARHGEWVKRIIISAHNPDTYPCDFPPTAHVAPIAAGEQVIASNKSETFRFIKRNYGDTCAVEMEGYGALYAANFERMPAIVIRGISDCVDDKTEDQDQILQPIAAAHASAFAFEMLAKISSLRIFPMPPWRPPDQVSDVLGESHPPLSRERQTARTSVVVSLEGKKDQLDNKAIAKLKKLIRQRTGDETAEILRIEEESIALYVDLSKKAEKKILESFQSGDLNELCGLKVNSILPEKDYVLNRDLRDRVKIASSELLNWPKRLPGGTWLERKELNVILEKILTKDPSATVLLGEPGSGKSALMATLAENLLEKDIPVLAIKADLLSATISSPDALAAFLNLPSDPAYCLKQLAKMGKVALLLDQLDALAGLVDLRTERLNVLLNLVRELSSHPSIHIVASSRTFDFNHDVRLRHLEAESITLELPAWGEINQVLRGRNLDGEYWPESFRNLLRSPQCLQIFLKLLSGSDEISIFSSYQAMLDRLWEENVLKPSGSTQRVNLLTEIAIDMAERETLSLPFAKWEEHLDTIVQLEAAGILRRSNDLSSIGFSHQTMFEHALARAFVKEKQELFTYVMERQDGLFIRPRLWASLTYLRSVNRLAYERELEFLWKAKTLRTHLRYLLIDFIGQQTHPSDKEGYLLLPYLYKPEIRQRVLRSISRSPGWFEKVVGSYLPALIEAEPEVAFDTLPVLHGAWHFAGDKVTEIIERYWLSDRNKDILSWRCYEEATDWDSRAIENVTKIISRTDISNRAVNFLASRVSVSAPELAPAIIAAALNKQLSLIQRCERHLRENKCKQLLEGETEWYDSPAIAESAPESYLQSLWPWYLKIFEYIAEPEVSGESRFRRDYSLATGLTGRNRDATYDSPLMIALEHAVECFAANKPDEFVKWHSAWENNDLLIVQRLLAVGLKRCVNDLPGVVFHFLISDERRLALGDIGDIHRNSKELIEVLVPHLSNGQRVELEDAIIGYEFFDLRSEKLTAKEKQQRVKGNRNHRLRLLRAFPPESLSDRARQLLHVEERALPGFPDWDMKFSGAKWIGSPMSREQMERAKDEDILKILYEIDDHTKWEHPKDFTRGGSIQLSREFAEFAKINTDRAIRIIGKLEPGRQERPVAHAVEAIAQTDYPPESLFDLIFQLDRRGFSSEEFRQSIARAVENRAGEEPGLPESLSELLEGWLVDRDEPSTTISQDKDDTVEERSGSILWGYSKFRVLPHGNYPILETLTRAYLARRPIAADRWLDMLERHLQRKEDFEVWRALSPFLRYLSHCDKVRANGFLARLFRKFPDLLSTYEGVLLIANTHVWIDEETFKEWLDALHSSTWDRNIQAYGELLALHTATVNEHQWAVAAVKDYIRRRTECSSSEQNILVGIAYTAANLWQIPPHREFATAILVQLMPKANKALSAAIMDVFRVSEYVRPDGQTQRLLLALYQNKQLIGQGEIVYLVHRIQDLLPYCAEQVYQISMAIIDQVGTKLKDITTAIAGSAPELTNIALTLHRLGNDNRERGLTLFEKLLNIDAYEAKVTLDELDGRLLSKPKRISTQRRRRRDRRKGRP